MIDAYKFFQKVKTINLIVQTTEECNIRCKHCYESCGSYKKGIMSYDILEEIIIKTQKQYDDISYLWFGGEPLLAGINFFKKVVEFQEKYKTPGMKIANAVQTNGILIDEEFISFFKENNFKISVSFDCQFNDYLRQKSDKVIENIKKCQDNNLKVNVLSVLHSNNIHHQDEMIRFLSENHIRAKFNRIFCSGEASKNQEYLIDDKVFLETQKKEFKRWLNTDDDFDHPFFRQIVDSLFKTGRKECVYSACMFKWASFDPLGNMYTCPRFIGTEYCFGNVVEHQNIYDCFCTEKYLELASKAIERKEKCKATCKLYKYCKGGCNAVFYENGDLTQNKSWFCTFNKQFIPFLVETLFDYMQNNMIKNKYVLKDIEAKKEIINEVFVDFNLK